MRLFTFGCGPTTAPCYSSLIMHYVWRCPVRCAHQCIIGVWKESAPLHLSNQNVCGIVFLTNLASRNRYDRDSMVGPSKMICIHSCRKGNVCSWSLGLKCVTWLMHFIMVISCQLSVAVILWEQLPAVSLKHPSISFILFVVMSVSFVC